jgi:succinate dehydrogenase hydrophobic anchor subunit
MSASSRVVYGREGQVTPLWLWLVQRTSAVLLGPVVIAHMTVPGGAVAPWLNALLLAIVLAHGFSGTWRLAAARRMQGFGFTALVTIAVIFTFALAILGIAILIAVSG